MIDTTRYWLAGILEGEGSFMAPSPSSKAGGPLVTVCMTDRDVIERVAEIFGTSVAVIPPRQAHHKESYRASAKGSRAATIMMLLLPLMGTRRKSQIGKALEGWDQTRVSLLPWQEAEIARRLADGEKAPALAKEFSIRRETVYRVARRTT